MLKNLIGLNESIHMINFWLPSTQATNTENKRQNFGTKPIVLTLRFFEKSF